MPSGEDKIVHHIAQQTATQLQAKGHKSVSTNDFIIDYDQKVETVSPKELKSKLLEQLQGEL